MTDTGQDIGIDDTDPLFGNDTVRINDTVTDADGSPKDLSTANLVEFEIFDELGGTSQLRKTTSDARLSIVNASNDVVQVDLNQTETDTLAPSRGITVYEYRVRVTDSDGDSDTVTTGEFGVRSG